MNKFFKKYKIELLVIFVAIVVMVIIYLLNMVSIEAFLEKKEFLRYDEATYYVKRSKLTKEEFEKKVKNGIPSEYDYFYFGLGTNHLSEETGFYEDGVKLFYTGEYNYKTRSVIYSLRGEYKSTIVHFTGNYNFIKNEFSCEPLLHHDIKYNKDVSDTLCELSKNHCISLYNNSVSLVDDEKVLNKIIKDTD